MESDMIDLERDRLAEEMQDDFTIDFHPLQLAMVSCIRDQLESGTPNKFILRMLSREQLQAVIAFVESFDQHNLSEE
jgi:hypothetical protein